jgi:hypothetical protein
MKKIIIAPLFTMLVVSCGTVLPSQSESSLVSQVSSSSNPSSSTPSASEEPVSNRKVPFNQIGSLVAQVVDAKAMGIVNSKDRVPLNGRRNQEGEDQNYMVKVTETYNPNTQITEDQTIQVTFTRVTNTQTTELQTGTATHVATADPITIERATDLPGNIVITNVIGYEFRLLSGETIVEDWMSSDLETIEFIFDEALTDIVIESRSLNASISFTTFEDFTYTVKQGDQVLYEDILDNDLVDNNEAVGAMTISGLTQGLAYDVTYAGYQVIEIITQDEVDGQVDKLYVLYQYTFISFVPLNLNPRPEDQDLELDYDDIPLYDKTGFYSDSTKQSFVVDNNTGLIYKIEDVKIASISKGLLWIENNFVPYDLRVNSESELEFYPLFTNSSIVAFDAIKDKYGNKFIFNNRLNMIDELSNTTFYVHQFVIWPHVKGQLQNVVNYLSSIGNDSAYSLTGFAQKPSYWLTKDNEVLMLDSIFEGEHIVTNAKLITKNQERIDIPSHIDTTIIDFNIYSPSLKPYKINQGKIYFETLTNYIGSVFDNNNQVWIQDGKFSSYGLLGIYDIQSNSQILFYFRGKDGLEKNWHPLYLKDHDLLVEYVDGKVTVFNNISIFFEQSLDAVYNWSINRFGQWSRISADGPLTGSIISWFNSTTHFLDIVKEENITLDYYQILTDVGMENGEIIKFGINGNIQYELIAELINDELIIVPYVKGTYVAPAVTTITLQPINK